MTKIEIVPSDEDIESVEVRWYDDGANVWITQIERGGVRKQSTMLNIAEARQVVAALTAYVDGNLDHKSDCALFNSPSMPVGPCNCR